MTLRLLSRIYHNICDITDGLSNPIRRYGDDFNLKIYHIYEIFQIYPSLMQKKKIRCIKSSSFYFYLSLFRPQ